MGNRIRIITSIGSSVLSGGGLSLRRVGLQVDLSSGAVSLELGSFRCPEARFALFGTSLGGREGLRAHPRWTVMPKMHQKQDKNQSKGANQPSTRECWSKKTGSTVQS